MVLSTAVFKALKRRFPPARFTVLASERNHEIIMQDRQKVFISPFLEMVKQMKEVTGTPKTFASQSPE